MALLNFSGQHILHDAEIENKMARLCLVSEVQFGHGKSMQDKAGYLVCPAVESSVILSLANSCCLVLLLQLGRVAHFPLLAPKAGMGSPWRFTSCLRIMEMRSASDLRLICIAVAAGASE